MCLLARDGYPSTNNNKTDIPKNWRPQNTMWEVEEPTRSHRRRYERSAWTTCSLLLSASTRLAGSEVYTSTERALPQQKAVARRLVSLRHEPGSTFRCRIFQNISLYFLNPCKTIEWRATSASEPRATSVIERRATSARNHLER